MSDQSNSTPGGGAWTGGGGRIAGLPQRSFGLKLLLVCGLALLMAIPAMFVWGLVYERERNADNAIADVSQARGGRQSVLGPVIVVPYEQDYVQKEASGPNGAMVEKRATRVGSFVIYAGAGAANARVKGEILKRGIHDVPVFETEIDFSADFDIASAVRGAPRDARMRWADAVVYLGLSDLRGVRNDVAVTVAGVNVALEPTGQNDMNGAPRTYSLQGLVGAPLDGVDIEGKDSVTVAAGLHLTGAQRLSIAPFAKDTKVVMTSDWPAPSFDGGFLPVERSVTDKGFTAEWRVPFLARGAPGEGVDLMFDELVNKDLGVSFIDAASPYQSVNRALKYAPMFMGLVFLSYFLFEATSDVRAHPAQYVLVGLAQAVFYLLLLGVSEHFGFMVGFLAAAVATVLQLSLYAGSVFKSTGTFVKALATFATLYTLIYILMRMEDYALLVGAVASFLAIAGAMFMTRNLDWYGLSGDGDQARA